MDFGATGTLDGIIVGAFVVPNRVAGLSRDDSNFLGRLLVFCIYAYVGAESTEAGKFYIVTWHDPRFTFRITFALDN